jgi:hypothetical protein
MDEKGNFSMKFTESSVRRKRDLDEITHAADVNEDLVGTFFREASAKLAYHRKPVLPPFLRLSIQPGIGNECNARPGDAMRREEAEPIVQTYSLQLRILCGLAACFLVRLRDDRSIQE